jgi:predicted Zn finger-like uncharacterized protein
MAIRITCPGCKTAMKLGDDKRGKKVRCSECDKVLNIPGMNGKKQHDDDEAMQEGQKLKAKAAVATADEEEEEEPEEERPAKKKKKKKKKQGSGMGLIIGIVAGVVVLLLAAGGGTAYMLTRNPTRQPPPGPIAQNKDGQPEDKDTRTPQRIVSPDIREGNPANIDKKVGGKSITGNVRGAIYRTERRAELRQIGLLYTSYCDETPRSARSEEGFLKSMERDYRKVVEVIREGYYVINMKADPKASGSIVVYERDIDTPGYLCGMTDGTVDYVPLDQWKKALGK